MADKLVAFPQYAMSGGQTVPILAVDLGGEASFALKTSGTSTVTYPITPDKGGTGVPNNAASTLTISGNFGTTITVTGTTAITLPTTGTLVASGTAVSFTTITATTKFVGADSALVLSGATSTTTGIGIATNFLSLQANGSVYVVFANDFCQFATTAYFGNGAQVNITGVNAISARVGGTCDEDYTAVSTTSTDGTENDLFTYTTPAYMFLHVGQAVRETEQMQTVSSATATRRIRKYFAGSVIFDSGTLTLSTAASINLTTLIVWESATVARCCVTCVSNSAPTAPPPTTYTRITGLDFSNPFVLKTTGVAAGTGAASGDIVDLFQKTEYLPSATL